MTKALLFDFDGTLADTLPAIFEAFQGVFREFLNKEIRSEDILARFGPTEAQIIREELAQSENSSLAVRRFYELYRSAHDRVRLLDEMPGFLSEMRAAGVKLGIVTGKGRESLAISLECLNIKELFDVTITGDDVTVSKPHPEGINKAMRILGSARDSTVFVGDSEADIRAGQAAGVTTVGVRWFSMTQGFQTQPDMIFDNFDSFRSYVNNSILRSCCADSTGVNG